MRDAPTVSASAVGLLRREGSARGRFGSARGSFWSGSRSDRREKKLAKSLNVDGGIITVVRVRGHIGGLLR